MEATQTYSFSFIFHGNRDETKNDSIQTKRIEIIHFEIFLYTLGFCVFIKTECNANKESLKRIMCFCFNLSYEIKKKLKSGLEWSEYV